MQGDFIKEQPQAGFTGAGTYNLGGAYSQGDNRFRDVFLTGAPVEYVARTLVGSPLGVKWEKGIGTLTYGTPDTLSRDVVYGSSSGGAAISWQATDSFVIYCAPILQTIAPMRTNWIDGATALTVTANHLGAAISMNVTAADRTITLPLGSTLPRHFRCAFYGRGSTSNHVILAPTTPDWVNEGAAGATASFLGGAMKVLHWDTFSSAWRTH